jgi:hypothetical protein
VTAFGDEDIRGFDVAVDDSLCVGSFQSIGCLDAKVQQFVRGDGPCADPLLQSLSFDSSITITGWLSCSSTS